MLNFLWPLKKSSQTRTQHYGDIWVANSAKQHTGIDLGAVPGDSVFAVASGTITKIGSLDDTGAWAKYAVLEHDAKDYCTSYLHIDPKVIVGQKIKAGDLVGIVANISGPHFHFNVWKGPRDEILTQRGSLPAPENVGKVTPKTDPAFPSNFLNPDQFIYTFSDGTTSVPIAPSLFTRDLAKDCIGPEVLILQKMLNSDPDTQIALTGPGSPGTEKGIFADLTQKAVQKFQVKYKLAAAGDAGFGLVGPKTKAKLQELFGNKSW